MGAEQSAQAQSEQPAQANDVHPFAEQAVEVSPAKSETVGVARSNTVVEDTKAEDDEADQRPKGVARVDTNELMELVPKIQAATARNTVATNAQPTTVPAPQKQFFGVLGQRHVICITGLPNNGKAFVAKELGWYLEFFHGARVEYFEVDKYTLAGSRDANAFALLHDVTSFLCKASGIGKGSPVRKARSLSTETWKEEDEEDGVLRKMKNTDSGRVAIILPPRMSMLAAVSDQKAKEMWNNTWSCTNALDRNWIRKRLAETRQDTKLMFIEIELTDQELLRQHADAAKPAEKQEEIDLIDAAATS